MPNPSTDPHVVRVPGAEAQPIADQSDEARSTFVTGLKNAHAMESQALSIMRPQLKRIENYPEIAQRLEQHIAETENQQERLEQILDGLDEDKSGLKDTAMSMAGGMTAIGHTVAGDEILKNAFANFAFANYEIAAYKSLLALARNAGASSATPQLQNTLDEEVAMARWLDQNLETVTMKYVSLREKGHVAKH